MAKPKNHYRAKAAKRMAASIVTQFESASPKARKDMAQKLVRYLKLGVLTVSSVGENQGVELNPDMESFQRAFSNQVWVYAGINAIATSAAKVPFKVMRKNKKGELEEVVGHPFIQLLNNPNEHLTCYDLIELMMIFLESSGSSYWLLDDGSGQPLDPDAKLLLKQVKEIWPIFPQHIRPLPRKKTFIGGYKMAANEMGKETIFAPAEILHIKYANPVTLYLGQGSLEPVRGSIIGDLYSELWNNTFFKNGAIPPAFLKTEKGLTPEQREELKASWGKVYAGAKNAHKVALLENGLDFSVPSQSRKDMEFVEGQNQAMKRILGSLNVPPIMIGLLDEATYNNAKEQKRVFWENAMTPKLTKIASAFTNLLHRLGEPKDLVVIADLSGIEALQEDLKAKADTAKVWRDMGVPLNACIKAFGPKNLEPVEGGDVGLVNAGLVPLEEAALGMAGQEIEPEGTPEDAPPPKKPGKPGAEPDPAEDDAVDGEKALIRATKKQDDAAWKSFVTRQRKDVAQLRAILKSHFRDQRAKVLELIVASYRDAKAIPDIKLRSPKVEVFMLPWSQETKDLAKEAKPQLKKTYGRFGKSAVEEVGAGIDFNLESPAAVRFAESRAARFAEQVNATTQRRLREIISQGLEQGTGQADMVDAIKAEFDFAEQYRALRIARTETQIAANSGQYEGYRQADVTQVKWLSSRDAVVRDSHKEVETVDMGDPFDVGGVLLRWPCDPDGPASEIINCRCTTRAIINRRTA